MPKENRNREWVRAKSLRGTNRLRRLVNLRSKRKELQAERQDSYWGGVRLRAIWRQKRRSQKRRPSGGGGFRESGSRKKKKRGCRRWRTKSLKKRLCLVVGGSLKVPVVTRKPRVADSYITETWCRPGKTSERSRKTNKLFNRDNRGGSSSHSIL